jgi:hypothetical protein
MAPLLGRAVLLTIMLAALMLSLSLKGRGGGVSGLDV